MSVPNQSWLGPKVIGHQFEKAVSFNYKILSDPSENSLDKLIQDPINYYAISFTTLKFRLKFSSICFERNWGNGLFQKISTHPPWTTLEIL